MEERVPPTSPDAHHDEEFGRYYNLDHEKLQIVPSTRYDNSHSKPHSTYIIQVPKDQIYRVPPPENAHFVERHRKPLQTNKKGRRRCLYWFLSIFFTVAFLVSVIVCVHRLTLSPKNPTFSVKHLVIKRPAPSKNNASPKFQVILETTNINSVNDIRYEQGNATLGYKGKEIGHGYFPALESEECGKADAVNVVLTVSSKGGLPKEFEPQSHKNKNHNEPLKLNLSMRIPLKMKTWLYTKNVGVKVDCKFEVNSVADNIKLLSQKCGFQK